MSREFDLLVARKINSDLILSGPDLEMHFGQPEVLVEKAALTIGSSCAIFACGAAVHLLSEAEAIQTVELA